MRSGWTDERRLEPRKLSVLRQLWYPCYFKSENCDDAIAICSAKKKSCIVRNKLGNDEKSPTKQLTVLHESNPHMETCTECHEWNSELQAKQSLGATSATEA